MLCSASSGSPRVLGFPGQVSQGAYWAEYPRARFGAIEVGVSPVPFQHAPEGGLHCSANLRGAEVFLAGSRPAGLCSLWPKSTSFPQDASGLSSCQEQGQGTWDIVLPHITLKSLLEEPLFLCSGLLSIQRVSKKHWLSKSGSVLPGKRVGRNAILPVRAHWDSPGMESGPLPCSCQASPAPGQSWARPLPRSQHSLGTRCSALSREGAAPAPHSGVRRDFARSCCRRWRKPFNSIPCPRIHQPGSRDGARKSRESAELRSAVLGAVCSPWLLCSWLEISAGISPRQTASSA